MAVIMIVLAGLLLLSLVSGAYVFVNACVRRKEMPWLIKEEIAKTHYGRYADFLQSSYQWLIDHNAQDIWIESEDGLRLHGHWIPAENAKGTILLAHGYRSTMLLDFGCAFEVFHDRGFNVLVPNQRSHGESQGRFITFGVLESRDMVAWLNFHNEKFGMYPTLLYGISMGASTMLYLANKDLPSNVKGIIADCGFTMPAEIITEVFRSVLKLPALLSIRVADVLSRIIAGFSLYQEDSRKTLAASRLPVLLIHGRDDNFVPCEMSCEAFAACTGPKELLIVDGAGHGVSFLVDPKGYSDLVDKFIADNIC